MPQLLLAAALIAGIIVLTPTADAIKVPQPILLLIFGLGLALVPGLPSITVPGNLVLPVVLPPLLFAATQRTTVAQFRRDAGAVLLLAVGLTLFSAVVATVVAHLAGLPWTAAAVLGAIVSPPDPVAATAVARRLRLPERMVTILEGEGMFNDATALVLFKVALAVAVTGHLSVPAAGLELVRAIVFGVGMGAAVGWLTVKGLSLLRQAAPETTLTLAAPFVAYLAAEQIGGSGVLAVLTLGLFLRSYAHPAITAQGWLVGRTVWEYIDFLITGLVFALVGFELTTVIQNTTSAGSVVWLTVSVIAAVVIARPLWIFAATAGVRAVSRRRNAPIPVGWQETTVVSWAGMRGVVTVATALSLPPDLPQRASLVLVALLTVLVTLLAQGLSLTALVRQLGVGSDEDEGGEIADLRHRALTAAVDRIRGLEDQEQPWVQAALQQYEGRLKAQTTVCEGLDRRSGPDEDEQREMDRKLNDTLVEGVDAERELVLRARNSGQVTPAAADDVLREIEGRASRIG